MAIAQGNCPNCGAPIEFAIGASLAKVCEYCRHTVVRSDRGLSELGKVADLAPTSSLIAVGDEGTLAGRPFRVLGRVQLDHGQGPWDEYYVAFDFGQAWGWLAYAQGEWLTTSLVPAIRAPAYAHLRLEMDVVLGQAGSFRVGELRTARIVSAAGELPGSFPAGFVRHYADLAGARTAFATLDFGDGNRAADVYLGWAFPEAALQVSQQGPRSANQVATTSLRCAGCGGDVPALAGARSERLGCPYCGALSDLAEQRVIAAQAAARATPSIPIGSRGRFEDREYVCIALVRRGSDFDGELYSWEEYLLWTQGTGFRWLVDDPETGWSWVQPASLAELDLSGMPAGVRFGERLYTSRNQARARVLYVLGEVYWKCQVGETTAVADFEAGEQVLSREEAPGEVHWSLASPLSWAAVAQGFGLPSAKLRRSAPGLSSSQILTLIVLAAFVICVGLVILGSLSSGSSAAVFRGGGAYYGGK